MGNGQSAMGNGQSAMGPLAALTYINDLKTKHHDFITFHAGRNGIVYPVGCDHHCLGARCKVA